MYQVWRSHVLAETVEAESFRAQALYTEVRQHRVEESLKKRKLHALQKRLETQAHTAEVLEKTVGDLKEAQARTAAKESETSALLLASEEKLKGLEEEMTKQSKAEKQEQEDQQEETAKKEAERRALEAELQDVKSREEAEKASETHAVEASRAIRAALYQERQRAEKLGKKLEELRHEVVAQRANMSLVTKELASTKAKAAEDATKLQANLSLVTSELHVAKSEEVKRSDAVFHLQELLDKHKMKETLTLRQMRSMEAQLKRLRAAHSEDVYELHDAQQRMQRVGVDEEENNEASRKRRNGIDIDEEEDAILKDQVPLEDS